MKYQLLVRTNKVREIPGKKDNSDIKHVLQMSKLNIPDWSTLLFQIFYKNENINIMQTNFKKKQRNMTSYIIIFNQFYWAC